MSIGRLSDLFEAVVVRRLSPVEQKKQHELHGPTILTEQFGHQAAQFDGTVYWIPSTESPVQTEIVSFSWGDRRLDKPKRRPEYRLYYSAKSKVIKELTPGDLLAYCILKSGEFVILAAGQGTDAVSQLAWLFSLRLPEGRFNAKRVSKEALERPLDAAVQSLLEGFGISVAEEDLELEPSGLLDVMLSRFGPKFPLTYDFSAFARETFKAEASDADHLLSGWMTWETYLFIEMERHLVRGRLTQGFGPPDDLDVNAFVSFAKSVNNTRKCRAGYAFQHHFTELLNVHKIAYDAKCRTENKKKPDFLFPSCKVYHSSNAGSCDMVGLKTSCKDRWRQVLQEADAIREKHLLTLEPSISVDQVAEMMAASLRLVIPKHIHETYDRGVQESLLSVEDLLTYLGDKHPRG